MNIEISNTFIKIWQCDIDNKIKHYKYLDPFIPMKWQTLLTSNGSLTRNARILAKSDTKIMLLQQNEQILRHEENLIRKGIHKTKKIQRRIWLIDKQKKLIFAESAWPINRKQNLFFKTKKPIGTSLIESELNVHRELITVYYGYCELIEKQFGNIGPLWGRSYRIYLNKVPSIIINEIFSPYLVEAI
jgi:chorismate lyase